MHESFPVNIQAGFPLGLFPAGFQEALAYAALTLPAYMLPYQQAQALP